MRTLALEIDADTGLTAEVRSSRMESEVAQAVVALAEEYAAPGTDDAAVVEAHAAALAALDAAAQKYHWAAVGYTATDEASADAARAQVVRFDTEENAQWDRWITGITALLGG